MRALRVPDYQRVMIDTEISNFHMNLAACERLFSQPIPIAYTRHTSRYNMACSVPSLLLLFTFCSFYNQGPGPLNDLCSLC